MYDLIILGGGPAGCAAAVYASRKQIKSLLITEEFGGQSTVSPDIQNWIGTISLSGDELAKNLEAHARAYADGYLEFVTGTRVEKLEKTNEHFTVTTTDGKTQEGKTILVATGGDRRKLQIPGAAEFENKGVVYCASCDGPLFQGMDVAVVGGGNAGFETAAQLLAYTKSVTLLDRNGFKADEITIQKVLSHENMTAIKNTEPTEITGETLVNGLTYKNRESGEENTIAVQGVFVEIGLVPNTQFAEDLLEMDKIKRVKVDPRSQKTSVEGVWAAGDCTDELYHQNNIAVGDAVKATEDIYQYLNAR